MNEAPLILSQAVSLEILDGIACALLAAAAACRARGFGGNFGGAIALGCLCGLVAPLVREVFLHGHPGTRMVMAAMPDDAFIGALAGAFAPHMLRRRPGMVFFWLDCSSLSLASVLAAVLAFRELGIVGALALGLCAGLAPGYCRDVALGDVAELVERDWYASAAAIGCILAFAALLLPAPENMEWFSLRRYEWAIAAGALLATGLQAWKSSRGTD